MDEVINAIKGYLSVHSIYFIKSRLRSNSLHIKIRKKIFESGPGSGIF